MSVSSFLTRDGWRSKWILWGESISITQLLYGCTSIFGIEVVFTHCRWFCAETFGTTCSLGYPCLWFLQKLRQQVFNQEGFFANLNAEASTCKIFVNFRVFLRKSYHLRILYPHIFSPHESLCRILLILSWCFHLMEYLHNTDCLQASGEETFFSSKHGCQSGWRTCIKQFYQL